MAKQWFGKAYVWLIKASPMILVVSIMGLMLAAIMHVSFVYLYGGGMLVIALLLTVAIFSTGWPGRNGITIPIRDLIKLCADLSTYSWLLGLLALSCGGILATYRLWGWVIMFVLFAGLAGLCYWQLSYAYQRTSAKFRQSGSNHVASA